MNFSGSQKITDWSLVIVVNFMWAAQVPVIRLICDRLGTVAIAFIPLLLSTLIFCLCSGPKTKSVRWASAGNGRT